MLYSRESGHHRDREREKEALKSRIGILQSYPEALYAASDLPDSMDVPFSVKGQWEIDKGGEADGKMGPDADDGESAGFSDSSLSIESGKNFSESQQKSGLPRVIFDITKSEESGPGSRGGIVVGYWPSGKPKYLSELQGYDATSGNISISTDEWRHLSHKAARERASKAAQRFTESKVLNLSTGSEITFPSNRGFKKALSEQRTTSDFAVVPSLPALVATAKKTGAAPDSRGRTNVYGIDYFSAEAIIDGKKRKVDIVCRTVDRNRQEVLMFYTHKVEEKPGLQPANQASTHASNSPGSPGDSSLADQNNDRKKPGNSQQKSSLPRVIYEASPTTKERDEPGSPNRHLPPTPGTITSSSPGSHLAGIENNTAGFNKIKQKTPPPYQVQKAGLVPKMCEYCREWEASQPILRVFASYAEFARSEFYAGGDLMQNDPYAEYAVWPGKTNANRHYSDWWICTPVHPNCNHSYQSWEPPDEEDYDFSEHFADLDRRMAERQQKAEEEYYGKSRIAPMEVRGVWHERTCACEDPAHDDRGSWVREYIARRFPVVVG